MQHENVYQRILLSQDVSDYLNIRDVNCIENVGIPSIIIPLSGNFYKVVSPYFIDNKQKVVIAETTNSHSPHFLIIDIKEGSVMNQWNFKEGVKVVFVNSDISKLIASNRVYEQVVRKMIIEKSLGAYYENTPQGGYFEKYSQLLKEIISCIDEKAANEGVWHSLILEMSMGVI